MLADEALANRKLELVLKKWLGGGASTRRSQFRAEAPRLLAELSSYSERLCMGKGDSKTRRGKIYKGSYGKSRPKDPTKKKKAAGKK